MSLLELNQIGLKFERQVPLPLIYKSITLDCGYRIDVIVKDLVILELKTVEKLLPIHEAQLLTYLKIANKKLGMLLNFNVPILAQGIKRIVNNL